MNKCDRLRNLLLQWANIYYLPLKQKYDECDKERLRYRDMAIQYKKEKQELERIIKSKNKV